MAEKITGGLAPDIVLGPGYILRVTALHPTTGALVTGVTVSDVTLQVNSTGEPISAGDLMPDLPIYLQQGEAGYAGTASA